MSVIEQGDGGVDRKGVIDMKIPGTGTLESVQVRSRVKSFTEVTRKSSYIGTFAAGDGM